MVLELMECGFSPCGGNHQRMQPQQGLEGLDERGRTLLTCSGAMGTAATFQVVDQRQSARSYGLGGMAADLPASRSASGRHSLLAWTRSGRESEPLPFSLPGFAPLLAVGTSWPKAALSCGWPPAPAHGPG
jgi:hypothetical protein